MWLEGFNQGYSGLLCCGKHNSRIREILELFVVFAKGILIDSRARAAYCETRRVTPLSHFFGLAGFITVCI
jgi:hypothetical protein